MSIPVTGGLKLDQGSSQHMVLTSAGDVVGEEVTKKREVRLYKNRSVALSSRLVRGYRGLEHHYLT